MDIFVDTLQLGILGAIFWRLHAVAVLAEVTAERQNLQAQRMGDVEAIWRMVRRGDFTSGPAGAPAAENGVNREARH